MASVSIYALQDPASGIYRYVGKTGNPVKRLSDHMTKDRESRKGLWIARLKAGGLKPGMKILEVANERSADSAEGAWIVRLRLAGHPLFNITKRGEAVTMNLDQKMEQVLVTPQIAKDWIGLGLERERVVRPDRVELYARAMIEGKWKLNGEPIKFDSNGKRIDGQHRLAACVLAGVPFLTWVARGIEPSAHSSLDGGLVRLGRDAMHIGGVENANSAAAFCSHMYSYKVGRPSDPVRCSIDEQLEIYTNTPRIQEHIAAGVRISRLMPASYGSVLHALFSASAKELCDSFFDGLATGADLSEDSPVLALRRRLESDKSRPGRRGRREIMAVAIKAWNWYKTGSRWSPSRVASEARRVAKNGTSPRLPVLMWKKDEPFPEVL